MLDRSPVQVGLSRGTPFVEVHATVCRVGENQPSEYELRAWTDLHRPRQARIMTRAAQAAAESVSARTHVLGELAAGQDKGSCNLRRVWTSDPLGRLACTSSSRTLAAYGR